MLTVAITIWNGTVSPLFDAAGTLLVIHPDQRRETIDITSLLLLQRIAVLEEKRVQALICGAISQMGLAILSSKGIKGVPWVRGDAEEVYRAFSSSSLATERFALPGCPRGFGGSRHRYGRGAGRGRGWRRGFGYGMGRGMQ